MTQWLDVMTRLYLPKGRFVHRTPEKIRLFPFTTHSPSSNALLELSNFQGICGQVNRILKGIVPSEPFNMDTILESIDKVVETKHASQLADIIRKTAFQKDGRLFCFHPKTFYYRSPVKPEKNVSTIAAFCSHVLFEGNSETLPDYENIPADNIFHRLILKFLPPLQAANPKQGETGFYRMDVGISNVFKQDIQFITGQPRLATKYLPEVMKFYYMIYQFKLLESLHSFFEEKKSEPLYFSLDWERLSRERTAYHGGWRRIDSKLDTLFTHAHCLEMLNYLPLGDLPRPVTYRSFNAWLPYASDTEKDKLESSLDQLISFYKRSIEAINFNWSDYKSDLDSEAEPVHAKILDFWSRIHYQFKNSVRSAPAGRYAKWLFLFAADNYIKNRGRIGRTLAFDRQQMMFLSRLCIGNRKKLRLRALWKEFARRGVAFDFDSQRQIVALFEKLNLLEKKSDSGDAQYVRAIF